jgi:hypothetical protein
MSMLPVLRKLFACGRTRYMDVVFGSLGDEGRAGTDGKTSKRDDRKGVPGWGCVHRTRLWIVA